jgi:Uncharacterised nucleotidyltransferase
MATESPPIRHRAPAIPWGAARGHHFSWPTPVQADLLRATLLEDERALNAWRRIRPLLDVERMDSATLGLLPQLRHNLVALGCDDELLELFKGVHRYTWARNHLLLAEAMPVVAALEQAGLPTLLLKGAALVADQRQNAGMRQLTDIDVLVPLSALAAACRLLVEHGMTPVNDAPLWYVVEYETLVRHSRNFRNAAEGQLDLHWHALKWSCHPAADDEFWAASQPVELRGVRTRALCPADELLLAILHGLQWMPIPTYRWVLDATLLARGLSGPVDFDRLAREARRHRVAAATRAGLAYLGWIAGVEVPDSALRQLRVAAPLQRLELRAQVRSPRERGAVADTASRHLGYVRRHVAPGSTVSPVAHARLAAQRLGVERLGELRYLRPGGRPGPGRPYDEDAAPLGTGVCAPPPTPWGSPLDFGDPDTARAHCLYGLWLADGDGSWIAGREARLAMSLPETRGGSALVQVTARCAVEAPRQRLQLWVENEPVGELVLDATRDRLEAEGFVVPARLLRRPSRVVVTLRTPDAIAPVRLGIGDDSRPLGVYLQRLVWRLPRTCSLGQPLMLGSGTEDEPLLAGGWAAGDPEGRWTEGPRAQMLVHAPVALTALEWDAIPLVPTGAPPLRVELSANGVPLGSIGYGDGAPRLARLPLGKAATAGELLLSWRIRDPRSPHQFGASADRRRLGLFFRSVTLF